MKNTFRLQLTLGCFLITNVALLHAQDILWEKSYGGKHADYLFDIVPTPDYGYILAGSPFLKKLEIKQKIIVVIWIIGFGKWMKKEN